VWVDSTQPWRGEQYVVRALTGSASTKPYRCPGCDQEIRAGTPHVVVWPEHDGAADHRRHWHNACWRARDRRTTRIQRSRNAPHHG
jgi:hypothetical protein